MKIEQTFHHKDIQMKNKHMNICSTSLATRKMQIKRTICDNTTYQLEIVPILNTGENVKKLYLSYFGGGNIK